MFAELSGILGASTDRVERGKFTLICDCKTDGSFLVHHFLSYYLKAGCKVCFVALVQSFSHYNIVAQKLGVNLVAAKDEGQLVFLEGLRSYTDLLFSERKEAERPNPLHCLRKEGLDLKPLYEFVSTALAPSAGESWKCPVLILDDVSVLLSLGVGAPLVLDFMHYCRATVCSQYEGNLMCLVHSDEESEDEENDLVRRTLQHQSNMILEAEGLTTGFCKDVHGQLKITRRAPPHGKGERDQCAIYQFKIQDKNVTFFARGLSSAVL
ncbi:elongator complex protein 6 [Bombina bombina]|uniref:elongator complex protein 6 n=1 Tax=Bombina bombina TaxID=8345 RepID=UPI00235A4C6C|nr:elongator complex protein 6 [Bombina bombina]